MAEEGTNESRESAGDCLFCNFQGCAGKKEVVCVITEHPPLLGYENRGPRSEIRYECGLGDIGKNCVIPKIYQLASNGSQVGLRDDLNSLRSDDNSRNFYKPLPSQILVKMLTRMSALMIPVGKCSLLRDFRLLQIKV
jgi:hypothetical protein